jgi:hypothetical protein
MPGYRTGSFDAPKDLDKTTTPDNSALFIPLTPPGQFSPMPDDSLLAWYDASTLTVSNDAPVTLWPDASNHVNDLVTSQFTPTPPTCVVAGQNGKRTVAFSGTQGLQGPSYFSTFPPVHPWTIVFCFKPTAQAPITFFSDGSSADSPPRFVSFGMILGPTSDTAVINLQKDASNNVNGVQWGTFPATHIFPLNTWLVCSFTWDGLLRMSPEIATPSSAAIPLIYQGAPASGSLFVNGKEILCVSLSAPLGDIRNWSPILSPTMFGNSRAGNAGVKGQIAEFLFYGTLLSENARVQVERYLHHKWAI